MGGAGELDWGVGLGRWVLGGDELLLIWVVRSYGWRCRVKLVWIWVVVVKGSVVGQSGEIDKVGEDRGISEARGSL